mmetsp:Transcript_50888/g.147753  ORF Transcript_50888/g.147753 Transcript_50888/m.147753 type:complete len:203 (-) Transcript_50888:430-1038(-)
MRLMLRDVSPESLLVTRQYARHASLQRKVTMMVLSAVPFAPSTVNVGGDWSRVVIWPIAGMVLSVVASSSLLIERSVDVSWAVQYVSYCVCSMRPVTMTSTLVLIGPPGVCPGRPTYDSKPAATTASKSTEPYAVPVGKELQKTVPGSSILTLIRMSVLMGDSAETMVRIGGVVSSVLRVTTSREENFRPFGRWGYSLSSSA